MRVQNIKIPLLSIELFLIDVTIIIGHQIIILFYLYNSINYSSPVLVSILCAIVGAVALAAFSMGLYQRQFLAPHKLPQRLAIVFVIAVAASAAIEESAPGSIGFSVGAQAAFVPAFILMYFSRRVCCRIAEHRKRRILYFGQDAGLARLMEIERSVRPQSFSIVGTIKSDARLDETLLHEVFENLLRKKADKLVVSGNEETMNWFAVAVLSRPPLDLSVTTLATFVEKENRKLDIYDREAAHQLTFYSVERTRLGKVLKRTIDVCFASLLLVFTFPITVLVSGLILALDGRPIFYQQDRVGLGERTFKLIKFRSMTRTAEADGVARWAAPSDDRVTPIGRFLRLSRIDEIPQLINVLRGEMSLVGPRPERPSIVTQLEAKIPLYACRHTVIPGLTGWAQINYPYGASVEDAIAKTCFDLYYVKNASLLLDMVIVLQTIRVILLGEGSR